MSKLIIADLNFLEREFSEKSKVKGGGGKQPKLYAALDADLKADLKAYLKVDGTKYKYAAGAASAAAAASASSTTEPVTAKVMVDAEVKLT